jgi:hypothetical protein
LLRAYFTLNKIRNIDGFYYIRRLHREAATVSPKTALGNSLRNQLTYMWQGDFELIKSGTLDISQSSLRPASSLQQYRFKKMIRPNRSRRMRRGREGGQGCRADS